MKWPLFGKRKASKAAAAKAQPGQSGYRAVEVIADLDGGCAALKRQRGQRYLMHEAPDLPLPGCTDVANCHCKYVRFQDRREEARRDADLGIVSRHHLASERRANDRDRRSGK